jgi:hypothetical protein
VEATYDHAPPGQALSADGPRDLKKRFRLVRLEEHSFPPGAVGHGGHKGHSVKSGSAGSSGGFSILSTFY